MGGIARRTHSSTMYRGLNSAHIIMDTAYKISLLMLVKKAGVNYSKCNYHGCEYVQPER